MRKEVEEYMKINVFTYLGISNKQLFDELVEEYRAYREVSNEPIDAYEWILSKIEFVRKL